MTRQPASPHPAFPSALRSPALWLGVDLLAPFLPILLAPAGRVLGHPQGDGAAMFYYYNDFAGNSLRRYHTFVNAFYKGPLDYPNLMAAAWRCGMRNAECGIKEKDASNKPGRRQPGKTS